MVEVELRPGDIEAAKDFDVSNLLFRCILKALEVFPRNDETTPVVHVKNDHVNRTIISS